MATSLLEAVLVIAIIAIVSAVALTAAMNHIENARLARAVADTEAIGISIHSFMHDTGFAPAFKNGNARGPEDGIFLVLETDGSNRKFSRSKPAARHKVRSSSRCVRRWRRRHCLQNSVIPIQESIPRRE